MTALVTGGTGFVGGAIVRQLLRRGRRVRVLARPASRTEPLERLGVEIARGDIRDAASVDAALDGCDTLYHAAAIYEFWIPDEDALLRTEVDGTRNVLEAARRRGIAKLVYTSTALVVGEPRGVLGTEETPHRGYYLSRYEKAKALAERVAEEYLAAGLPVVILRPAAVLGPGDLKTTGRTLIEVLNRRVPALVRGVLSVADIDDVAEAHLAAETRLPGERYIVAAAVVTAEEIFTEACRLAGVRRPPFVPAPAAHVFAALEELRARLTGGRPMLARETVRLLAHGFRVDGAKAARELGLRYRPWRDSLRRAVGWYWEQGLLRHRPSVLG